MRHSILLKLMIFYKILIMYNMICMQWAYLNIEDFYVEL